MSLQRLAHRICLVKALTGKTLAGDKVRDSAIAPIDVQAAGESAPFIAVYTDDFSGRWRGFARKESTASLALILEIGVTAKMLVENPDDPDNPLLGWGIPATDGGIEITLDMIERQIEIALQDESNPWAEMWRRLHTGDPVFASVRGASAEKGVRFAGRQLKIEVEPYDEPPFGPAASGNWAQFLAMMEADDDDRIVALAPAVRSLIESDTPPPDYIALRRRFGMDDGEMRNLLVAQVEGAGLITVITDPIAEQVDVESALEDEETPP